QQTRSQVDSALRVARRTRDSTAGPSLPLARHAGRYTDALYGDATITLEQGTLVLRFSRSPAFVADLSHWQYDTFRTGWRTPNLAHAFVTFGRNRDAGGIRRRRREARRLRRLHRRARGLRRARGGPGRPSGSAPRGRQRAAGGCADAPGDDRALPRHQHLSLAAG